MTGKGPYRQHPLGTCEYCDLGLDHNAPAEDMCPNCDTIPCRCCTRCGKPKEAHDYGEFCR